MSKTSFWFAGIILSLSSVLASSAQVAHRPGQVRVRQEPCWQQVGISKEIMEQREAIARDTRSQVAAVCADSSLTPPQQKEKIHEIRQDAKQKNEGLLSQQQQEDLRACQKERAANHPSEPSPQRGQGPCGELTPQAGSHPTGGAGNSDENGSTMSPRN